MHALPLSMYIKADLEHGLMKAYVRIAQDLDIKDPETDLCIGSICLRAITAKPELGHQWTELMKVVVTTTLAAFFEIEEDMFKLKEEEKPPRLRQ
jgi:hypothetical protein